MKIVHLESEPSIIEGLRKALPRKYQIVSTQDMNEASRHLETADLWICGSLGKYSLGLLFALERLSEGDRVLILAHRQKFSKIPFLSVWDLSKPERVIEAVESALAGGS